LTAIAVNNDHQLPLSAGGGHRRGSATIVRKMKEISHGR
jgi:hypothetical protein